MSFFPLRPPRCTQISNAAKGDINPQLHPLHYSLLLMSHEASLRYIFFMIIHEAVMKDKYSLSSTSEEQE